MFKRLMCSKLLLYRWHKDVLINENGADCSNLVLIDGKRHIEGGKFCLLCGRKDKVKILCRMENCRLGASEYFHPSRFHVSCARQAGFEFMDEQEFSILCFNHTDYQAKFRKLLKPILQKNLGKMSEGDLAVIYDRGITFLQILGWAWRWSEWWVTLDNNRLGDVRRCQLAAFGAALRNRDYDTLPGDDYLPLTNALRGILKTRSLVGIFSNTDIDILATWLARIYRTKNPRLSFGKDCIPVETSYENDSPVFFNDGKPKYELGRRPLPGKSKADVYSDDFLYKVPTSSPPKSNKTEKFARSLDSETGTKNIVSLNSKPKYELGRRPLPGKSKTEVYSDDSLYKVPTSSPPKSNKTEKIVSSLDSERETKNIVSLNSGLSCRVFIRCSGFEDIEDIHTSQPLIALIVNVGNRNIETNGPSGTESDVGKNKKRVTESNSILESTLLTPFKRKRHLPKILKSNKHGQLQIKNKPKRGVDDLTPNRDHNETRHTIEHTPRSLSRDIKIYRQIGGTMGQGNQYSIAVDDDLRIEDSQVESDDIDMPIESLISKHTKQKGRSPKFSALERKGNDRGPIKVKAKNHFVHEKQLAANELKETMSSLESLESTSIKRGGRPKGWSKLESKVAQRGQIDERPHRPERKDTIIYNDNLKSKSKMQDKNRNSESFWKSTVTKPKKKESHFGRGRKRENRHEDIDGIDTHEMKQELIHYDNNTTAVDLIKCSIPLPEPSKKLHLDRTSELDNFDLHKGACVGNASKAAINGSEGVHLFTESGDDDKPLLNLYGKHIRPRMIRQYGNKQNGQEFVNHTNAELEREQIVQDVPSNGSLHDQLESSKSADTDLFRNPIPRKKRIVEIQE